MICPQIINRDKGHVFSLFFKLLEFFSCQQSLPTTLNEGTIAFSFVYHHCGVFAPIFLKLDGHRLMLLTHKVLAASPLEYGIDFWFLFLEH
jgi:hypothetical protein